MISVDCPGCGKSYSLDPSLAGKKGRCKVCRETFEIGKPLEGDGGEERLTNRKPASSSKPATPKPAKPKPVSESSDDDEMAGLNSVSSDGESIDELPELPPKRKRRSIRDDDDDVQVRPKKKRKSESSNSGLISGGPLPAVIAATVGGGLGAVIWGVIVYFTHHEVGYVAWGIGGLVGFCVKVASGDMDEGIAGFIAAGGAVLSILAGKLLAAYLIVQWLLQQGQLPPPFAGVAGAELKGQLVGIAFMHSFGVLDIVFFLLAIMTAFKLGSGQSDAS